MGNTDPLLQGAKRVASGGILLPVPPGGAYVLNAVPPLAAANNPATGQIDFTITPGLPGQVLGSTSNGVTWVTGSPSLYVSIVDMALGAGSAGITSTGGSRTQGVGFAATVAGHFCTGARFYYLAGAETSMIVDLWNGSGTKLATAAVVLSGTGTYSATFASPFALVAGQVYCISMWGASGTDFTSYNGSTSGTAPLGNIMPFTPTSLTVIAGSFIAYAGFAQVSGGADIYGNKAAGHAVPSAGDASLWAPLEPLVV